jgi:hypothetical protein
MNLDPEPKLNLHESRSTSKALSIFHNLDPHSKLCQFWNNMMSGPGCTLMWWNTSPGSRTQSREHCQANLQVSIASTLRTLRPWTVRPGTFHKWTLQIMFKRLYSQIFPIAKGRLIDKNKGSELCCNQWTRQKFTVISKRCLLIV